MIKTKLLFGMLLLALGMVCMAETIDPASFGFDPNATPRENSIALQKALDGGNKEVLVSKPGTYGLDRSVFIDSHTKLSFVKGVVLKKCAQYAQVLVNRGAYNYGHDEDIEVRGLEISVNGFQLVPGLNSPARNLRGQLAFYNVKNVRVYDFKCVDFGNWQYCVHFCLFEDVLVDGFEIRGKKDGIHFNCGRKFIVRNGVLATRDDGIAVNAGDWPDCAPVMGDVTDGLVEKIVMDPPAPDDNDKRSGELGLAISSAWIDWYPGMKLQRNDTVRVGQNVYGIYPMPLVTNEYVSLTKPTHTQGTWKSPEGINFFFMQSNGVSRAEVKNVLFRDVICNHKNGLNMYWLAESPWARSVRPELKPEDYPKIEIAFERVKMTHPGSPILNCCTQVDVTFTDCSVNNAPFINFYTKRLRNGEFFPGIKRRVTCNNCTFDGPVQTDFKVNGLSELELVLNGNKQTRELTACAGSGAKITVSGDAKIVVK